VHMRISCPPTTHSCYYGVDTPNREDLIASSLSTVPIGAAVGMAAETDINAIRDFIGADSLGYLSLDGMLEAIGIETESSCTACWTGKYPTLIARTNETAAGC